MKALTISQQRELLDLYDQLYRLAQGHKWHSDRKEFDLVEDCYDKFKDQREAAICELSIEHYQARLDKLS